MRLALAQINTTVGDIAGNGERIWEYARRAHEAGAEVVVFPEMTVTGYPPEDLLLDPSFISQAEKEVRYLASRGPRNILAVVGAPDGKPGALFNAAFALRGGRVVARYHKNLLPNYGVFDEQRYFLPGTGPGLVDLGGVRLGITICEDIWHSRGPGWAAARAGAALLLNLSASPYHAGKQQERRHMLENLANECRVPVAYANLIGGQDELVYDGGSRVMDRSQNIIAQAPVFEESLLVVDVPLKGETTGKKKTSVALGANVSIMAPALEPLEEIYSALMLGTRDYVQKNGFDKVLVGLSGGIDSAFVATLAVDALGADHVVGVTMPSPYNSRDTQKDAELLATRLGVPFLSLPIDEARQAYLKTLAPLFADREPDVTEENLQSRIRGTLLMALSNKFGWLVLTTGNKSEISMGYFTLYGDSAGGFGVIKDLTKTQVYELARWRNSRPGSSPIPDGVLTRAPSAELRPHQKDQDTLPPYDDLDKVIWHYVEKNHSLAKMKKAGLDPAMVAKTVRTIDAMEYKRRQAPLGIKITPRAFGRDRRMPITNRFRRDDLS